MRLAWLSLPAGPHGVPRHGKQSGWRAPPGEGRSGPRRIVKQPEADDLIGKPDEQHQAERSPFAQCKGGKGRKCAKGVAHANVRLNRILANPTIPNRSQLAGPGGNGDPMIISGFLEQEFRVGYLVILSGSVCHPA